MFLVSWVEESDMIIKSTTGMRMSLSWEADELHREISGDKENTIIAVAQSSVNISSASGNATSGQEEEQGCISLCQFS